MNKDERKALEEMRVERDYYRAVLRQIADQKYGNPVSMARQAFDEYNPGMWIDMGRRFPWENLKGY